MLCESTENGVQEKNNNVFHVINLSVANGMRMWIKWKHCVSKKYIYIYYMFSISLWLELCASESIENGVWLRGRRQRLDSLPHTAPNPESFRWTKTLTDRDTLVTKNSIISFFSPFQPFRFSLSLSLYYLSFSLAVCAVYLHHPHTSSGSFERHIPNEVLVMQYGPCREGVEGRKSPPRDNWVMIGYDPCLA